MDDQAVRAEIEQLREVADAVPADPGAEAIRDDVLRVLDVIGYLEERRRVAEAERDSATALAKELQQLFQASEEDNVRLRETRYQAMAAENKELFDMLQAAEQRAFMERADVAAWIRQHYVGLMADVMAMRIARGDHAGQSEKCNNESD